MMITYNNIMVKRFLLSLVMVVSAVAWVNAEPVNPVAAARRAIVAMRGSVSRMVNRGGGARADDLLLVHTVRMQNEQASAYIYNIAGGGFVIASADDRFAPVLGFSDEGEFDAQNCPDGLRFLLGEYSRIIAGETPATDAVADVPSDRPMAVVADLPADVSPLLGETMWDQGAPYNLKCPYGYPVGCVATAMSQVMYYHKWPEKGMGSHSYSWVYGTLSSNFGSHIYDWDNMLPRYEASNYSEEQANAVATLCFDAGVAVNMDYAPGGSGTAVDYVAPAMKQYFGYSSTAEFVYRCWYSSEEWNRIMKTELASGRPVILSGTNYEGGVPSGHAFVCDGYSTSEGSVLFHINWGWNGLSNGYFLLSALDPDAQGTGGSSAGYNINCNATLGLQPNTSVSTDFVPALVLGSGSAYTAYMSVKSKNETQCTISATLCNYGLHVYEGDIAYVVEDADGTVIEDSKASPNHIASINPRYTKTVNIVADKANIYKVGTRVYFLHRPKDTDEWLLLRSVDQTWYMECVDERGTFEMQSKNHVRVASVEVSDTLYSSCPAIVKVTFEGVNEFYGAVRPVLLTSANKQGALGNVENLFVEQGGSTSVELDFLQMPDVTGSFKIAFQTETRQGSYSYVVDDETGKTFSVPVTLVKRTTDPVGLDHVSTDDTVEPVFFYGVDGILHNAISEEALQPGIYIRKQGGKVTTILKK